MNTIKKIADALLIIALVAVIGFSGYKLWAMSDIYVKEAQIKDEMTAYRPQISDLAYADRGEPETSAIALADNTEEYPAAASQPQPERKVNRSIIDLQNNVNEEVIGWITIPNTNIDYPILIASDNDFYLARDINKKRAKAGSIFVDYRCAPDFSDFNTIVYGHNMRNRSMFGDIKVFDDTKFFESNPHGTLFLLEETYKLKVFAYMVVRTDDSVIYNLSPNSAAFFEYVKKAARNYSAPSGDINIVTLSTCAYEFDGARMVLLANMIPLE